MKTSIIRGYFRTYDLAYQAVSERIKQSRNFSIQINNDAKGNRYVLIYYGKFA